MKLLLIIILFSLQNTHASAQLSEILFHPNGKMQVSNFQISDSLKIGLKKPFNGIIFNKLDSKFSTDTSLLYAELKSFTLKSNDSLEYYFFYNGTESFISIKTVLGRLPLVKVAQTKRGELSPINTLIVPRCGGAPRPYSSITIKPGTVLIFTTNAKPSQGDFKTLAKLRMQTSQGIITTRPFECSIDENSFYINSTDKDDLFWRSKSRQFIIQYRKEAFLEK